MSGSITELLLASCDEHADRVALIAGNQRVTYTELAARVRTASENLVARGMGPGQRVLFAVRPGVEALMLVLAIARTGATVVFIDPGMSEQLLTSRIDGRAEWACAESVVYAVSRPGPLARLAARRGLRLPNLRRLADRHIVAGRWMPFGPRAIRTRTLLERARPVAMPQLPDDAEALVIYTSGTTGAAKGVVHSHGGLRASMDVLVPLLATGPGKVFYTAELHTALPALLSGATVALPALGETPERTVAGVRTTGATCCYFVPADLAALLDHLDGSSQRLPANLRTVILGSAPVTSQLLERLHAAAPDVDVWCVYAMTEMLPVCVVSGEEKRAWHGAGDLVGAPAPGVRVDVGEDAVLAVSGPHLCYRYQGCQPHVSVSTGDIARIDDGRVILLGRAKDMIIRGHYNVYPGLYEDALSRIDGVAAVKMIGVPNRETGDEQIVLAVQAAPGWDGPSVVRSVERMLDSATTPVDDWARPDRVVGMELPLGGRNRKIDVAALRAQLAEDA